MLIATLEDEPVLSGEEDLAVLHLLGWWQCLNQTRRWRLCYRELHHVLNLWGWMIGFSRWLELVLFLSESTWRAQQFTASTVVEAVAQAPQPVQANGKVKAEMGDPAMEEVALWEIAPGGDSFVSFSFLQKMSTNEQFPLSLGSKRARRVVDGPNLDHTHPPLSSACSIGRFKSAIKGPNHGASAQPWNQVSVAPHTQTPLQSTHRKKKARAASLHSTSLPHCGYIGDQSWTCVFCTRPFTGYRSGCWCKNASSGASVNCTIYNHVKTTNEPQFTHVGRYIVGR